MSNMRSLLCILCALMLGLAGVQGGFWTFYLPNFLKPSGYSELTDMIASFERNYNETKDNYADVEYFWKLMKEYEPTSGDEAIYSQESACLDVFPLLRDLAIEYSRRDFEFFTKPLEEQIKYLNEKRDEWYPQGEKSKTILPREWEQKLYEQELEYSIAALEELTNNEEYKEMRNRLVLILTTIKRSLDQSLPCLYARYIYRHIAKDVNQKALEMNLLKMKRAQQVLKAAYSRINKFKTSDQQAIEEILEDIRDEERLQIKP